MMLFGLTGGVGMGKSTAARILMGRGVPVLDTDDIAREVVRAGQPALVEIQKQFGPGIVGSDGELRRDELARKVFGDPAARTVLEHILHPRIRRVWLAQVEQWRAAAIPTAVVVIPLLFETDTAAQFDAIICVSCTQMTQVQRLAQRGWTVEQIDQRRRAQWPVDKKIALADFLVWSEGSLSVLDEQLRRIVKS
jgi:dephospho-CoA kinase